MAMWCEAGNQAHGLELDQSFKLARGWATKGGCDLGWDLGTSLCLEIGWKVEKRARVRINEIHCFLWTLSNTFLRYVIQYYHPIFTLMVDLYSVVSSP